MKFFGWGRKKDPPPIRSEGIKLQYSDVARAAEYGSVEDQPRLAKELSGEDSVVVDHMDAAETWEERLQEKIRFVFSHEQEGLLAIGTFALDQLVTPHITDHKLPLPPPPPPPPAVVTNNHMSTSSSSSIDTTVIHEDQSSDDEAESTDDSSGSAIAACTRKGLMSDYPVFGDPGSIAKPVTARTSALCPHDDHNLTSCSHSPTKHVHDHFVDSDLKAFHNAGPLCGLFRLRRSVHRRRKPPKKKVAKNSTKGTSLGAHLGRLWRSRCSTGATHVSARVSPEKDTCLFPPGSDPPVEPSQTQGPPCIANCVEESASEVGEHRKRRSGPSFGNLGWASCAHSGNWIRTDSEFVVLEM